jgi:hypothetical protein
MPRAQGAPNRGSFAGLVIDLAQVADPTLTEAKILPAIRNAVHDLTRKSG